MGTATRVLKRAYYGGLALLSRAGTYDVAPDGRFLMLKQAGDAGQPVEPATVIVVKNWLEELKRLVPSNRSRRQTSHGAAIQSVRSS